MLYQSSSLEEKKIFSLFLSIPIFFLIFGEFSYKGQCSSVSTNEATPPPFTISTNDDAENPWKYYNQTESHFPHLPFEARRVVEMVNYGKASRGPNLHIFQNSAVLRLQDSNYLISVYDDFKQELTYLAVSMDEGVSWNTVSKHEKITSMNIFIKREGPDQVEYLYGMAHTPRGDYVEGRSNKILIYRFDLPKFYEDLETNSSEVIGKLPQLEYSRGRVSGEYNFITSNNGVFQYNGYIMKQFDIIPYSRHKNHQESIEEISGSMGYRKGTLFIKLKKRDHLSHTKAPLPIEGRFSTGMKVALGFNDIEGYISKVDQENNMLVLEVFSNKLKEGEMVNMEERFKYVSSNEKVLSCIQDRNSWWHTVFWARLDDDLLDPSSWKMTNILSGYANEHYELFNSAFDIGMPTRYSPYPIQIYPHSEEGFILQKPDGSLAIYLRFSNRRLCDMALEIPIETNCTVENITYPFWLQTPFFSVLPTFGRAHPALTYDETANGYWIVGNVGRSLTTMVNKLGLSFRESIRCIWERNAIGLYFSPNLQDWMFAGIIDYRNQPWFQLSYPSIYLDNNDMLITLRTTTYYTGYPTDAGYNNHNANAIYMYKIKNVRNVLDF